MKEKFSETENLKPKFPLNLQFFAEGDDQEPETTPKAGEEPGEVDEPSLSTEEQIQQLMLENAKLKKSFDRASSEAADFKKKYNATLSDAQKASLEKAEKEAERDELLKNLTRENTVNKLAKNFLTLGYTADMAEKAAAAQYDNDTDTLFKIYNEHQSARDRQKEAEWLKSRPAPQTGTDEGDGKKDPFVEGFDS